VPNYLAPLGIARNFEKLKTRGKTRAGSAYTKLIKKKYKFLG
jgi:hypothetical protein